MDEAMAMTTVLTTTVLTTTVGPRPEPAVLDRSRLRHAVLVVLVDRRAPTSIAEIVVELRRAGIETAGRASRAVSDALRTEVVRGRVARLQRGVYVARPANITERHLRYARQRVREAIASQRVALSGPTRPQAMTTP